MKLAQNGLNILLRRNNDPRSSATGGSQILSNCLKLQHPFGVGADELSNFIHEEHDTVIFAFAMQILTDVLCKGFYAHAEG